MALAQYGSMDTPQEQAFDDLARIAAEICGTPIAAVSLVGEHEQFFKARVGFDADRTAREDSFCAHAILTPGETMVVPDARADPRFADNPFVTGDPGIRFYAGAPLVSTEGQGLGSLCVIDSQPRTLEPAQYAALEALARLVMGQLELRRQLGTLAVAFSQKELEDEEVRGYEERFRLAFEQTAVGMVLSSPEGSLIQVNERFAELLGCPAEELVGRHAGALTHPDFLQAEQVARDRLLAGATAASVREQPYLRPDGTAVWAVITTSLVRASDGSPRYLVSQVEDVTERKRAEQALRQTESVGDALVSAAADGTITAWNPSAETLFGYRQEEVLGKPLTLIVPTRHRAAHQAGFTRALTASTAPLGGRAVEIEGRRRDGSELWIEISIGRSGAGGTASFTAVIRDVGERRRAQEAEREAARRVELLRAVAVAANEAATLEGATLYALEQVCGLTDWTMGHLLVCSGEQGALASSGVFHATTGDERTADFRRASVSTSYDLDHGPGRVVRRGEPVWIGDEPDHEVEPRAQAAAAAGVRAGAAFPLTIRDEVVGVLELFSDVAIARDAGMIQVMAQVGSQLARVAERVRAEGRLAHDATHDQLTGLPNRSLLADRAQQALAGTGRHGGSVTVLSVGVDRLKLINESLGYAAGDELLVHAAARIGAVTRVGDTIARVGDEFVVVSAGDDDPTAGVRLAQRVLDAFATPYSLEAGETLATASVGVAAGGGDVGAEALLRDAASAMQVAKARGQGTFEVADGRLREAAADLLRTETALHRALERSEFLLHYQPTVRLSDGSIEGVEALLRWCRPGVGLVGPDTFIPALEESGRIVEVGAWVLREACRQLAAWRDSAAPPLSMKVNLSARQLERPGLVEAVRTAVHEAGIPAELLTLEITESVAMRDAEVTLARLTELRATGVRIAIDDFGTGYSSLAYLHRLPVDLLKIDRTFVGPLGGDEHTAIADTVIELGHALGLEVLAEGVETEAQARHLRARGCDLAQGFLFARPLPAAEVAVHWQGADGASPPLRELRSTRPPAACG